jgi:predicted PurR-regulated permease PerM
MASEIRSRTRTLTTQRLADGSSSSSSKWAQRRDIPIALLAWIALLAVALWAAAHIVVSLLLLAIAGLLAFALVPAVKLLQRVMPRFLAIVIVYLVVFVALSLLVYFIVRTAITQVNELRAYITPRGPGQNAPIVDLLKSFGVSQTQIDDARQQIISRLESVATGALPLVRGIFEGVLDVIVVAMLSIYLMVDGSRVMRWLRTNSPLQIRERAYFLLDTLERIVGGYIRGQLTLALLIGVLVGVGMEVLQVRYAVLLGVVAFVLAFIPIVGTFISGAACVLLAFSSKGGWIPGGWVLAVVVLAYFVVMHALEGHIVGPRIVGHAIGIHPAVSLVALLAGGELFGIWGALFAAPLAGILQAVLIALWTEWRETHPEQFPVENALANGEGQVLVSDKEAVENHPPV